MPLILTTKKLLIFVNCWTFAGTRVATKVGEVIGGAVVARASLVQAFFLEVRGTISYRSSLSILFGSTLLGPLPQAR